MLPHSSNEGKQQHTDHRPPPSRTTLASSSSPQGGTHTLAVSHRPRFAWRDDRSGEGNRNQGETNTPNNNNNSNLRDVGGVGLGYANNMKVSMEEPPRVASCSSSRDDLESIEDHIALALQTPPPVTHMEDGLSHTSPPLFYHHPYHPTRVAHLPASDSETGAMRYQNTSKRNQQPFPSTYHLKSDSSKVVPPGSDGVDEATASVIPLGVTERMIHSIRMFKQRAEDEMRALRTQFHNMRQAERKQLRATLHQVQHAHTEMLLEVRTFATYSSSSRVARQADPFGETPSSNRARSVNHARWRTLRLNEKEITAHLARFDRNTEDALHAVTALFVERFTHWKEALVRELWRAEFAARNDRCSAPIRRNTAPDTVLRGKVPDHHSKRTPLNPMHGDALRYRPGKTHGSRGVLPRAYDTSTEIKSSTNTMLDRRVTPLLRTFALDMLQQQNEVAGKLCQLADRVAQLLI